MTQELRKILLKTVEKNVKGYILISAVFAVGLGAAAAIHTNPVAEEEIRLYITDFLSDLGNNGSDGNNIFFASLFSHVQFTVWMLLSSMTILGTPIIWICIFIQGFSYGTVLSGLFSAFGTKTLLLVLCGIAPHIVITAPSYLVYSCSCMKHSHHLLVSGYDIKKSLLAPFASGVCFLLIVCVGALIQAYLEPVLLLTIAEYFI